MQTNDKAWIWDSFDFSNEKPKVEKLCARFTSVAGRDNFLLANVNIY